MRQSAGQNPALDFVTQVGGDGHDRPGAVAIDPDGNVCITGMFHNTVDFDPGPGTANLTSAGDLDVFVAKWDAAGNFIWARNIGGVFSDVVSDISVDSSGNIAVVGDFAGTIDFDPGPGTFNLTSASLDVFILKLDASGSFLWAQKIGGPGDEDRSKDVTFDTNGNIITVGDFEDTVDFDPGGDIFNLTAAGFYDAFILKLSPAGNFMWAGRIGAMTGFINVSSIAVDGSGDSVVAGDFIGTIDFDPGPIFFAQTDSGSGDAFFLKLDAAGNFLWCRQFSGTDSSASATCLDIALDRFGYIYSTGQFSNVVDFDPGFPSFNQVSSGFMDVFVAKLDSSGNFVWAHKFGGTQYDRGHGIAVDNLGFVYTTGSFVGAVDFDPGPGTFQFMADPNGDLFVSKLGSAGNFLAAGSAGGAFSEVGRAIAVSTAGDVYYTGEFDGTVDFDMGSGVVNLVADGSGLNDIVVSKLDFSVLMPTGGIAGLLIAISVISLIYTHYVGRGFELNCTREKR